MHQRCLHRLAPGGAEACADGRGDLGEALPVLARRGVCRFRNKTPLGSASAAHARHGRPDERVVFIRILIAQHGVTEQDTVLHEEVGRDGPW